MLDLGGDPAAGLLLVRGSAALSRTTTMSDASYESFRSSASVCSACCSLSGKEDASVMSPRDQGAISQ